MQVSYNFRLERELKDKAFEVIESFGLTPSQALRLFLQQAAETNSLPLSFDYKQPKQPNQETINAIKQGQTDYEVGQLTGYSPDEISKALLDIANG